MFSDRNARTKLQFVFANRIYGKIIYNNLLSLQIYVMTCSNVAKIRKTSKICEINNAETFFTGCCLKNSNVIASYC